MPGQTASTERVDAARGHYERCLLCEHRCGADRVAGESSCCEARDEARVYRHRVEYGEELELVPSHLFYLSGCNLRCVFCIGGADAADPRRGRLLTAEYFADALAWGRRQGARNVQWVGGEPTIHIPAVLEVLADCGDLPPVVWKSNFFGAADTFRLLDGVVDVYVADFKFGNDHCARRVSGANGYFRTLTRNLLLAAEQADLIVRHLLLPGHFDCCYRPIVDWMHRHLPQGKFSIREGYLPCWHARSCGELATPLERDAGRRARLLAAEFGLNRIT